MPAHWAFTVFLRKPDAADSARAECPLAQCRHMIIILETKLTTEQAQH